MKPFRNPSFVLATACLSLVTKLLLAAAAPSGALQIVNIAKPEWGTRIMASTVFSEKYDPSNLADGATDGPHCWFGKDGATLPQDVVFVFAEKQTITGLRLVQARWNGLEYRCRDFQVEVSNDGKTWKGSTNGSLTAKAGAECHLTFEPIMTKWLRVVITSSFDAYRTCGLAEVEIYSPKPAGLEPPYAGATRDLRWDVFGRQVLVEWKLEPAAGLWSPTKGMSPESQ